MKRFGYVIVFAVLAVFACQGVAFSGGSAAQQTNKAVRQTENAIQKNVQPDAEDLKKKKKVSDVEEEAAGDMDTAPVSGQEDEPDAEADDEADDEAGGFSIFNSIGQGAKY